MTKKKQAKKTSEKISEKAAELDRDVDANAHPYDGSDFDDFFDELDGELGVDEDFDDEYDLDDVFEAADEAEDQGLFPPESDDDPDWYIPRATTTATTNSIRINSPGRQEYTEAEIPAKASVLVHATKARLARITLIKGDAVIEVDQEMPRCIIDEDDEDYDDEDRYCQTLAVGLPVWADGYVTIWSDNGATIRVQS